MYSFEEIMNFHPDNKQVYDEIKKNLSVLIPFVGAGLTQFAYYSWSGVLFEIAKKITNEDDLHGILQVYLIPKGFLKSKVNFLKRQFGYYHYCFLG